MREETYNMRGKNTHDLVGSDQQKPHRWTGQRCAQRMAVHTHFLIRSNFVSCCSDVRVRTVNVMKWKQTSNYTTMCLVHWLHYIEHIHIHAQNCIGFGAKPLPSHRTHAVHAHERVEYIVSACCVRECVCSVYNIWKAYFRLCIHERRAHYFPKNIRIRVGLFEAHATSCRSFGYRLNQFVNISWMKRMLHIRIMVLIGEFHARMKQ